MISRREKCGLLAIWGAIIWFYVVTLLVGPMPDDSASVNVFPDPSAAKNYQLEANVTRVRTQKFLFFYDTSYTIDSITWPNGGHHSFHNCIVKEISDMTTCEATNGETMSLQLQRWTNRSE